MTKSRIGFVTPYDASNIKQYSRTGHYMAKALREQFDVSYFGPLIERSSFFDHLCERFYRRVIKQKYDASRSPRVLKSLAEQVKLYLDKKPVDLIVCPGTGPVAYLDCKIPIVIWWDATFAGWQELSRDYIHYSAATARDGHRMERQALARCSLFLGFTDWAVRTTVASYPVANDKAKVLPVGPNLDCNRKESDVQRLVAMRSTQRVNLLFVAADWKSKGGDIALETTRLLNEAGIRANLIVVGCHPMLEQTLPYVDVIGFVSKSDPEGRKQLECLFSDAHFLILPTRRDCSPIVIIEANSFGVPAISTDVGGVSDLITNGTNGQTFSLSSPASVYADYILRIINDPGSYDAFALCSFQEYQRRFDWTKIIEQFAGFVDEIINTQR